MNQTRVAIEIYVRRGPHKLSVQYGPHKNVVLVWFIL